MELSNLYTKQPKQGARLGVAVVNNERYVSYVDGFSYVRDTNEMVTGKHRHHISFVKALQNDCECNCVCVKPLKNRRCN